MTDTETLIRSVIKRRSELELIYYTTDNEDKKNNCKKLIDFLYKRHDELEQKLEEEKKKINKSWYSKLFKKNSN